jgi:putrescine aminotransferase
VAKALFGRGILISGTYINAQVLRVEPPLVITYPELDRFLSALEASLQDVSKEHGL